MNKLIVLFVKRFRLKPSKQTFKQLLFLFCIPTNVSSVFAQITQSFAIVSFVFAFVANIYFYVKTLKKLNPRPPKGLRWLQFPPP